LTQTAIFIGLLFDRFERCCQTWPGYSNLDLDAPTGEPWTVRSVGFRLIGPVAWDR